MSRRLRKTLRAGGLAGRLALVIRTVLLDIASSDEWLKRAAVQADIRYRQEALN